MDAARIHGQLLEAIRLAYVARRLPVPYVLLGFADAVGELAREFRESAEVHAIRESAPAKLGDVLPPSLTAEQAAAVTGVSSQYVRQLARQGDVTASKAGGRGAWRIDTASVLAWANRRAQDAREAA